jgi:hypothetical protein
MTLSIGGEEGLALWKNVIRTKKELREVVIQRNAVLQFGESQRKIAPRDIFIRAVGLEEKLKKNDGSDRIEEDTLCR